jgi:hypothetical protein
VGTLQGLKLGEPLGDADSLAKHMLDGETLDEAVGKSLRLELGASVGDSLGRARRT